MSPFIGWNDITIRLVLTVAAGALIGLNRSERGRAAGLRTTLLVCLAASIAMMQADILLGLTGKTPQSFGVFDTGRLPLGILSGIGFIGGGAILKRDDMVVGVTTAATLWFVTVIGLCFGGGQLVLGISGTVIAIFVLWCLKWVEDRMPRGHRATLSFSCASNGAAEQDIRSRLAASNFRIAAQAVTYDNAAGLRRFQWEMEWRGPSSGAMRPDFLAQLAQSPGIEQLEWKDERP